MTDKPRKIIDQSELEHSATKIRQAEKQQEQNLHQIEEAAALEAMTESYAQKYGPLRVSHALTVIQDVKKDLPGYRIFENPDAKLACQWLDVIDRTVKEAEEFGETLPFRKLLQNSTDNLKGYIYDCNPADFSGTLYYAGNAETQRKMRERHADSPQPPTPKKRKSKLGALISGTVNLALVASIGTLYLAHEDESFAKKIEDAIDAVSDGDMQRLKTIAISEMVGDLTKKFATVSAAHASVLKEDNFKAAIVAPLEKGSCVEIEGISSKDQNWFDVAFTLNGKKQKGFIYRTGITPGKPDGMDACEAFAFEK